MRYVIVRGDMIENVVEWDGKSPWKPPEGTTVHRSDAGNIGWRWNDGEPIDPNPPPPPPPRAVPPTASSGDFIRALYELGWYADVDAAAKRAGGLAALLWSRAATFERRHPLVLQIAREIRKTEADLDELFTLAGSYA